MREERDHDYEMLRRYLLGDLPGWRARRRLEERLLAEEELSELAEAIEDEILESYARGELSLWHRWQLRQRLAVSRHGQERLAMILSLTRRVDEDEIPPPVPDPAPWLWRLFEHPAFRAVLATSLVFLLIGIGALGLWHVAAPKVPPVPAEQVAQHAAPLHVGPPSVTAKTRRLFEAPIVLPSFVADLSRVVTREGGDNVLEIPRGTYWIHLRLDLRNEPHEAFRAVIETAGEKVWTAEGLTRQEGRLDLRLQASKLPAGRYTVNVWGLGPGGEPELVVYREVEVVRL